MPFFKHKEKQNWIDAEDQEIEAIIKEINDEFPKISLIVNEVAEFRNALEMFKKTRKDVLAHNLEGRSRHLQKAFVELNTKFSHIENEQERIEKIHRAIEEDLIIMWIQPRDSNEKYKFYFQRGEVYRIGRNQIPQLNEIVSREHLEIKVLPKPNISIKNIGKFESLITKGLNNPNVLQNPFEKITLRFKEKISDPYHLRCKFQDNVFHRVFMFWFERIDNS